MCVPRPAHGATTHPAFVQLHTYAEPHLLNCLYCPLLHGRSIDCFPVGFLNGLVPLRCLSGALCFHTQEAFREDHLRAKARNAWLVHVWSSRGCQSMQQTVSVVLAGRRGRVRR